MPNIQTMNTVDDWTDWEDGGSATSSGSNIHFKGHEVFEKAGPFYRDRLSHCEDPQLRSALSNSILTLFL